jgi:hypothetical protein
VAPLPPRGKPKNQPFETMESPSRHFPSLPFPNPYFQSSAQCLRNEQVVGSNPTSGFFLCLFSGIFAVLGCFRFYLSLRLVAMVAHSAHGNDGTIAGPPKPGRTVDGFHSEIPVRDGETGAKVFPIGKPGDTVRGRVQVGGGNREKIGGGGYGDGGDGSGG